MAAWAFYARSRASFSEVRQFGDGQRFSSLMQFHESVMREAGRKRVRLISLAACSSPAVPHAHMPHAPQQSRCGCQRVLKAVPAGFGRTELRLTSYIFILDCFRMSWNVFETREGSSVL